MGNIVQINENIEIDENKTAVSKKKKYIIDGIIAIALIIITIIIAMILGNRDQDELVPPELNEKGYYEINNEYQLRWFADFINNGSVSANAILMADIKLENSDWTPIGSRTYPYKGSFDGNGYIIKNVVINLPKESGVGFFGVADSSAVIKDIVVKDADIKGCDCVGGIVGRFDGDTISGCVFDGSVSKTRKSVVGAGGIAGYNKSGTIENCVNNGTINGVDEFDACVGGVVGANDGIVKNCVNNGVCYQAGIVGSNSGTVTECTNNGKVGGGGIVGTNHEVGLVENCINKGDVKGDSDISSGIVRLNYGNIKYCENTGSVDGCNIGGGIVGLNYGNVESSLNKGCVSGSENAGAIVGYNHETVENCEFNADSADCAIGYCSVHEESNCLSHEVNPCE